MKTIRRLRIDAIDLIYNATTRLADRIWTHRQRAWKAWHDGT